MDELPHWRVVMRRERERGGRLSAMAHEHAQAIVEMRAILRERAKMLVGFDYVWEGCKPECECRFGYYTLLILWGDRLFARFVSKIDRTTNTFVILGLWPEDKALGKNEVLAGALAGAAKLT